MNRWKINRLLNINPYDGLTVEDLTLSFRKSMDEYRKYMKDNYNITITKDVEADIKKFYPKYKMDEVENETKD